MPPELSNTNERSRLPRRCEKNGQLHLLTPVAPASDSAPLAHFQAGTPSADPLVRIRRTPSKAPPAPLPPQGHNRPSARSHSEGVHLPGPSTQARAARHRFRGCWHGPRSRADCDRLPRPRRRRPGTAPAPASGRRSPCSGRTGSSAARRRSCPPVRRGGRRAAAATRTRRPYRGRIRRRRSRAWLCARTARAGTCKRCPRRRGRRPPRRQWQCRLWRRQTGRRTGLLAAV
jgi:hypothetical protein